MLKSLLHHRPSTQHYQPLSTNTTTTTVCFAFGTSSFVRPCLVDCQFLSVLEARRFASLVAAVVNAVAVVDAAVAVVDVVDVVAAASTIALYHYCC